MERWHGRESELEGDLATATRGYDEAARAGNYNEAVVWASEAIDLIDRVEPAAALVERISADAEAQLKAAAGLLR